MGVHGLWQLLSSTGKPVPLESLEGKVLAVDVSVWLHQLSKGMRDSSGNPLPNAHLHGLFTRICKLLYYRIKPVFVFDGGVPTLKKQTLASRRNKREDAEQTSSLMQQKILTNLIRSQALKEACGLDKLPDLPPPPKSSAKGNKDVLFQLPPIPEASKPYMSQKSAEDATYLERRELQQMVEEAYEDISKIDVESEDFQALPPDVQHEIMTDMRLRKKNYNLSKIVDLPDDSKDFANYQIAKLVKHNKLNTRLDEVRKEMKERQTRYLTERYGRKFKATDDIYSQRVVSEDSSHYILVKRNLKRKREEEEREMAKSQVETVTDKLEAVEETDELLLDSDEDSCDNVDIMEESRLIFEELSGKTDELSENVEMKSKTIETKEVQRKEMKEDSVEFKPRFRAVIEVESDSESESSEGSVQIVEPVVNEAIVIDDGQVDPDLQFAIELSLKEQRQMDKSKQEDSNEKSKHGIGKQSKDVESFSGLNKSSKNSGIPVISAGRQTRQRSNEQREIAVEGNSSVQMDSFEQRSAESLPSSSKTNSNKSFKKIGTNKTKIIDETHTKRTYEADSIQKSKADAETVDKLGSRNTYSSRKVEEMGTGIFKRKISCLSNESTESCEESSKVRKVDLSDVDSEEEADINGSSDSEGDFIEVKVDLTKVKEDELFPASMFETDLGKATADTKLEVNREDANGTEDNTKVIIEDDNDTVIVKAASDECNRNEVEALDTQNVSTSFNEKVKAKADDKITVDDSEDEVSENEELNDVIKDRIEVDIGKKVEEKSTEGEESEAEDNVAMVTEADDISLDSSGVPETVESGGKRASSPVIPSLVRQFESLNEQNVRGMRQNLASENRLLRLEQGRQERLAMSITDQMHSEAQELLQLFGIPFIVSPTEAEAQCAQLELIKLTNGTITDDSDIWLFGGKCVFKNFFNQQKHVECFKDVNISSQLGLTRESLINIALLCGSDYTEGIRGVGTVTAMEILAKFPGKGLESLLKLKTWWDRAQKEIKVPLKQSKLLSKLRDLDINEGFPSAQVVEAYLSPVVDDSSEKFSWSLPNLEQLRQFAGSKLKWNREKTDEVLLPVIKRLNEKQHQRSISAFFQPEIYMNPAPVKSKRLQKVVNKFINPAEHQEDSDSEQNNVTKKTRSKGKKGQGDVDKNEVKGQDGGESQEVVIETKSVNKEPSKRRTKALNKKYYQKVQQESERKLESKTKKKQRSKAQGQIKETASETAVVGMKQNENRKGDNAASGSDKTVKTGKLVSGRGRGRGRGRGSARSSRSSKIEEKKTFNSESESSVDSESDSSSSDDDNDDFDDDDDNSDVEKRHRGITVIQSGLNIDEILNLKMGCNFNEIKPVRKSEQEGKVIENVMNVNEILHLESGADEFGEFVEVGKDNTVKKASDREGDEDVDDLIELDQKISDEFANEGGFIREDDDEMEEWPETMTEEIVKVVESIEEKSALDSDVGQNLLQDKVNNVGLSEENNKNSKLLNAKDTGNKESCKIGTKRTRSSRTNSKRDKSEVNKSVTEQEPVGEVEKVNEGNSKIGTESNVLKTSEKTNLTEESKPVKSVAAVKPIRAARTGSKLSKPKQDSIYTSAPIQPVVTGLPWADKRKGLRKGQSAKFQGKIKLHTIAPVETFVRKSKQTETKKTFDSVNLSESDSDE